MAVALVKDRDVGVIFAHADGESGVRMELRGLVGVDMYVQALRCLPQSNVGKYSSESVESLVGSLKNTWEELDRYLTQGGGISSGGEVKFYSEFKDESLLRSDGFLQTRVIDTPIKSILEGGPFTYPRALLYFVSPGVSERLMEVTIPGSKEFTGHKVQLKKDRLKGGFLDGVRGGFSKRLGAVSDTQLVMAPASAIEARLCDYARKQIYPLDQL